MTTRFALSILVLAALCVSCGKDISKLPAEEVVHSGCSGNSDCEGGRCVAGLPGGLCTANCSSGDGCPDGTVCADTEATNGICLFTCGGGVSCRDLVGAGYVCDTESDLDTGEDVRVCID